MTSTSAHSRRRVPAAEPRRLARRRLFASITEGRRLLWFAPLLLLYAAVTAAAEPSASFAGDEGPLLDYAGRVLHLDYAVTSGTDSIGYLWHGPGIPVLLAPFVALGLPLDAMRFIGPALLFAAVLAVYRLLRTRLGARGAVVGAYAFGLYLPSYEGLLWVHKEPAALLLASVSMLYTARYLASARRADLVLAGLSLGGLAMVRLEYGWLILGLLGVALVWWALASHRTTARRSACVLLVAFATCLPWLAYTHALTGRVLYWGNSGGSSLYWMSPTGGRGETGQWHSWRAVSKDPALAGYRPFFAELKPLKPLERDSALQRAALHNIGARPMQYLRNVGANVERMWFLNSFRPRPAAGLCVIYAVLNSLLLAAAAWAAVTLVRRRRALPSETIPIAAFAVGTFAVHVFTSAEPRLMLPAVPALFALIGYALRLQRQPAVF